MRIIHIVESFAGGVYDFICDLNKGLAEEQHIIIHATRSNTPKNFFKDFSKQTKFIHWKNATREISPKYDLLALWELINILKKYDNVDVIHLHSSKAGFLGRIAARVLGLQNKVVYTPHGVSFLRQDVSQTKQNIFIWLEKIGSWFGGATIACSKSEMNEFHKYRLPADYINNGITCKKSSITHFEDKKLCVGTIGRITSQKNPRLFNQIAKHFTNSPTIEFLWIGDGELRHELNASNIHISGWLTREEVAKHLDHVDIYLSTSLWEGLPLSVLQAMCAAKPLILSDCVGNRDLVIDDYNGKIFKEFNEAIKILEQMIKLQYRLFDYGRNSKKLLENKFLVKKMVNDYKNLYMSINPHINNKEQ